MNDLAQLSALVARALDAYLDGDHDLVLACLEELDRLLSRARS